MKEYNENEILRLESLLIDNREELILQKFHQITKWNYVNKLLSTDIKLMYYTDNAPFVKIKPKNYLEKIHLEDHDFLSNGSKRDFDSITEIDFKEFSKIITESFGYDANRKKNYPSAGGLYSILPLIYIYDNTKLSFDIKNGIYSFDETSNSLDLIKVLDSKLLNKIKINISGEKLQSSFMFAYSINFKRSIAKYGMRGYRHALVEVGNLVQNVRQVMQKNNRGELCWSGFNDDQLTKLSGLNARNAPIVLLQWWG